MFACGHQVSFECSQGPLVRLAILVAELIPSRPPAGAKHVQSCCLDVSQFLIPDVDVGVFEIQALGFTGHVRSAHYREGLAAPLEVVAVNAETGT